MVEGGGTLLVPMWLRGLVQLLMAIIVRIFSNSGSMAMVAKILSLMMTTILKYWPRTRNTGRPSQTECQQGPPTVTAECMRGRARWAPNPMRGVEEDGRPRNFANDPRGLGQWTSVWKSQWAPTRVPAMRWWNEKPTRATLFENRSKNNLARFHLESKCFEPTYMMLCVVLVAVITSMMCFDYVFWRHEWQECLFVVTSRTHNSLLTQNRKGRHLRPVRGAVPTPIQYTISTPRNSSAGSNARHLEPSGT